MQTQPITQAVLDASLIVEPGDFVLEEGFYCSACGDDFEAGQQVVEVYEPVMNVGRFKAVTTIHTSCYQGEDVPAPAA